MEKTNDPIGIKDQYEGIVNMITEVENCQKDLEAINSSLLQATENTCSEYGDRILEKWQSKLFYLQRVLRRSVKTLKKHEEDLKNAIGGQPAKSMAEFQEYYDFCQNTAIKIRSKLSKYMNDTTRIITENC